MPHVLGPVDGPAPPTRNELLLQAENERLRIQLDAAREVVVVASRHLIGIDDHGVLQRAIDAYDKVVKEASDGQ